MNIHINEHTRFQSWEGQTIFNEYPVHIRSGNFTVTLLFHDKDSIDGLRQVLEETMFQIGSAEFMETLIPVSLLRPKDRRF